MGVNGIYGLSGSGLDIESMVKVGMMGKQNEYDRMYKKQTKAEWQKQAYSDVYKNINDFNTSKLTDYKLQSKMNAMTASTNNSSAFTVSANGSAVPMSHKVEVKSLSSNAYLMSTKAITRAPGASSDSMNLKDSMFQSLTDNGDGTYKVKDWNGNTKTVNATDTALSVTMNDGKSKTEDKYRTVTMSYADLAGNKSFNDLASEINKLGLNITASYDSVNDSFSLYNKNGGSENNITIKVNNDATAKLFNNLNLGESKNDTLTPYTSDVTSPDPIKSSESTAIMSGSQSVGALLGISYTSTRNATYVNGTEVTAKSDPALEAQGINRYGKTIGSGDILVRTFDHTEQTPQRDSGGNIVRDDSGAPIYDTNTYTAYQTAKVKAGTTEVDWDNTDSTTTNPITDKTFDVYTINGQSYSAVEDSALEAQGIKRYAKLDGSGDMLIKTSVYQGQTSYKAAAVETGTSNVRWSDTDSEFSKDNPVSNATVLAPVNKPVINGEMVKETAAQDANGVTTYVKTNGVTDGSKIYVKTEDDGAGNKTYRTLAEGDINGSNVDWTGVAASADNPVVTTDETTTINGETVTKAGEDTANGIVTYEKTDGSKIYVKTEDDGAGNNQYKLLNQSDLDISNVDWSKVSASSENPVQGAAFAETSTGEFKKLSDSALSFTLSDGKNSAKNIQFTYAELQDLTIDKVVDKINNAGIAVQASFEFGKFSIASTGEGEGFKTTLSFDNELTGAFFKKLEIGDGSKTQTISSNEGTGRSFNVGSEATFSGSNGEIVVDGRSYTNITDNKATIAGVTYTLLDKTESAATVTVTQDTSAIVDRVKQFVEDYNTMLQSLQDKYNETKYSDYGVLTKSQEDAMTKEQVEKWNEKAKSGLLNRDKYIGDIISKMREALSTPVEGTSGKYNSAFNIGISTITDQGKIELDEDKLKKVLAEEPNSVYEVFGKMGNYDSTTKTSDFSTSGVAQRLGDVFNNGLKNIKTHAGSSTAVDDNSELGNKIKEWQDKMSDFKTKMKTFEDLLYKKYDAMEQALQKLAMTMNYVAPQQ